MPIKNFSKQSIAILIAYCCTAAFFSATTVRAQTNVGYGPLPWELKTPEDWSNYEESRTSFEESVKLADIVVEGKIINCDFLLTNDGMYQPFVQLEVYKAFKGGTVKKQITVLGGEKYKKKRDITYLDLDGVTHPFIDTPGFFFIKNSDKGKDNFTFAKSNYNAVYWSAILAFGIGVHNRDEKFKKYFYDNGQYNLNAIEQAVYEQLQGYTGRKYKTVKKKALSNNGGKKVESTNNLPTITSYEMHTTPVGILDGTQSIITIHGTHLGTTKIPIVFLNANTGGILSNGDGDFVAIHDQFVSLWSDDMIVIKMPSRGYNTAIMNQNVAGLTKTPGSGDAFIVYPSGIVHLALPPDTDPIIPYAITNYVDYPDYRERHLYDLNGSTTEGDFTFIYDNSIYNNKPALAAFRRALNTWRKATGVRFTEQCGGQELCSGTDHANKVKVTFKKPCFTYNDPSALAKTTILVENAVCNNSLRTYIAQPEMVFANNSEVIPPDIRPTDCPAAGFPAYHWSFDVNNDQCNQYNFESAVLHELGHLLQQDHVINPTLMYWGGRGGTSALGNVTKLTDPITGAATDPALTGVTYVLQRDAASIY